MNFLSPIMLAGLAAVSLPIAIHMLNKFRVRTTDWGAMKFLLDSVRTNARKARIEDLILLSLRCLLIALAVIAFARPVFVAPAADGETKGESVAAVILLDNSASMSRGIGARTVFDEAKSRISRWLDEQPPATLAALSLVSDHSEAVVPKPSSNRGLFRKLLSQAETGDRGSDLVQAVHLAMDTLKSVTGRPREIRIYTDGQAKAWLGSGEILQLATANPGIRIIPIMVGDEPPDNAAIVDLRADGGIVAAGQPLRFHVEVANFGNVPLENIRVSLAIDGGSPAGEATIPSIAPGAVQAAGIVMASLSAGFHTVVAKIPADAFAPDNKRTFAFEVIRQMNVLMAEGNHQGPVMDRDGFFVTNALVPLAPEHIARHYLTINPVQPAALPAELAQVSEVQAVFLCNPATVPAPAARALENYVRSGGNLVIFPGELTDPEEWNLRPDLAKLLPATLGKALDSENALALQASNFIHPVSTLWNDPAQGSLGAIKMSRHFPLTPKPGAARTIVALANGDPAVVEGPLGTGNVVLFNSPATPGWSNFPLHPAFLPFLQRLMGHLNRSNESRLSLAPGEAFRLPVGPSYADQDFTVLRPDSAESRTAGRVVTDGTRNLIRYSGTERVGGYEVAIGTEVIAKFAVRMDPAESDLRKVAPAVIADLKSVKPTTTATGKSAMVVTRDLWTLFICIVAAVFIAETVLAHRLSISR